MARRKKTDPEAEVMHGLPEDGKEIQIQDEPTEPAPDEEGVEDPAPSEAPSASKVRLGDREFELDPNTAGAFEALSGMIQQGFDSLRQPAPQPKEQNVNEDDPWAGIDELLFTDPKAALTKVRDMTKKELMEQYEQDRSQMTQQQVIDKFWSDFWSEHNDLNKRDDQVFVEAVFSKNHAELSKIMDHGTLSNRLAELTREELLKLARRAKTTRASVESGGTTPKRESKPVVDEESNVRSISDLVKERRKKRREAMTRTA